MNYIRSKRKDNHSVNHVVMIAVLLFVVAIGKPGQAEATDELLANSEQGLAIGFNRDVRPILSDKCFACHGPDRNGKEAEETDLRLDQRESALSVIDLEEPLESELLRRVMSEDEDERMPPASSHKELTQQDVRVLTRWIVEGARYEAHWAFTLVPPVTVPSVDTEPGWVINNIDRFVLRRLKQKEVSPSSEADRRTLIRRLTFDLTGLPPTTQEVLDFVNDKRASAYERVVDRLLKSPRYGERMAVPWLDAVRYADTIGYHSDLEQPVSPYRDYVIDSFNRDLPFDQFTIEQLAGDLLPNATLTQRVATGYNRLNRKSHEGGIQDAEYLAKSQAERVRTTASAWLGSTLACAECHDHKFDGFTTKDFYSFAAFFGDMLGKGAWGRGKYQEDIKKYEKKYPDVVFGKHGPAIKVPGSWRPRQPSGSASKTADSRRFRLSFITISARPRTLRVLPRGNWMDKSGEVVLPATPAFLPNGIVSTKARRLTRLDLARWIASPDNPLTSRVVVNRLWSQFFGVALSRNTGDLGSQGQWPTHPELLDWLATEFVENGWSIKHIVRTIVMSGAYRQSSTVSETQLAADPNNRLFGRQSRRRLDAEFIRDNALAVAGLLDNQIGGRSARPYQPAGYYRNLNFPRRTYETDTGRHQYRRGVYTHWQRTFPHPMLKTFDAPSREECAVERTQSNTPLQALNLLNDPSFVEAARVLAEGVLQRNFIHQRRMHAADDVPEPDTAVASKPPGRLDRKQGKDAVALVFERILARPPSDRELDLLTRFHQRELKRFRDNADAARKLLAVGQKPVASKHKPAELAAMTSVARAVLNLHETVTRF